MSAKLYKRNGGAAAATETEITDIVPFFDGNVPLIEMGMAYQNGSVSQGSFTVMDPEGSMVTAAGLWLPPHTRIRWTEDAAGDELLLAQGRVSGGERGRGDVLADDAIEHRWTIDDANVDLRGGGFTEDWDRPAETDVERLLALQPYTLNGNSSTRATGKRPSTVITISTSHLCPDANTVVMPAKTYPAGTQPVEVVEDCASTAGKIFGVVIHHTGGTSHLCLLYILETDHSTYASSVKISDQVANWDPEDPTDPVLEPHWDQGMAVVKSDQTAISGLVSRYGPDNQFVYVNDPDQEDDYEVWIDSYSDGDSAGVAQATQKATAIRSYRSQGEATFRVSVLVLAEQHALLCAGMSLQIDTAPILGGFFRGTYTDARIVQLSWQPNFDGRYWAHMQLNRGNRAIGSGSLQPAATTPTGAPDCDDVLPAGFALNVDSADWTKQDNATPFAEYEAINVSASGDHALLTNGSPEDIGGAFAGDLYFSGARVTSDVYAAGSLEEMLWRFTITVMGNGPNSQMRFETSSSSGAIVYMPFNAGAPGGSEHDGRVAAIGGSAVDYTLIQGQSYYLRWKAGAVTLWEVGDPEPGTTASGGGTVGTPTLQFDLLPVTNEPFHGSDYTPSTVEVESLAIFSLVDDPNCLDDPGDSPYFARSDDPRFDTIVTDHGALTGLTDDDHIQYIKDSEFGAKGRLLAGTGAGTFDDLVVGSNGQFLKANSATTTGLEWGSGGGGGGPFEDVNTVDWKFTSPAETIKSTDLSSYLKLDTNSTTLRAYNGNGLDIENGVILTYSDFGLVIPVLSSDPGGGDSQIGQVYYNDSSDKPRWYNGTVWADLGSVSEILDIPTAETDTSLVLSPDGAGGVEFRSETGGSVGAADIERYTGGDITLTSTSQAAVSGPGDLVVAAVTGDVVLIGMSARPTSGTAASIAFEFATMVSGSPVTYVGANSGTPTNIPVATWYIASAELSGTGGAYPYVVQSGDLSGGNLTLRLYARVSANRTIEADASNALVIWVKNLKQ